MSNTISASTPLGELLVRRPASLALLERLRLDYCCGGARTLAEACAQRGLDAHTVIAMIEALEGEGELEPHDIRQSSIAELCDHIVGAHHDPTRRDLSRIAELLDTVVRVHGGKHGELTDLARVFAGLRTELEEHMALEEDQLFPFCRSLDAGGAPPLPDPALIALLEHDHELTGEALSALRELSGGYDPALALCGTHRALLEALRGLEVDVHQHVHEENNVLFPRVRELAAAHPA